MENQLQIKVFSHWILFFMLESKCNQLSWRYDKTAISCAPGFPLFWFILLSPSFYFNIIIEGGGQIGIDHLPQSNDPSTICA